MRVRRYGEGVSELFPEGSREIIVNQGGFTTEPIRVEPRVIPVTRPCNDMLQGFFYFLERVGGQCAPIRHAVGKADTILPPTAGIKKEEL